MRSKPCYGTYISCHVRGASFCVGKQQSNYKAWIVSGGAQGLKAGVLQYTQLVVRWRPVNDKAIPEL
jgi:hypothetical protein